MSIARSVALATFLSLAAVSVQAQCTQTAPANQCSPGGGTKVTDCAMEWLFFPMPKKLVGGLPVADANKGINKNRIICYEGDPRCDFDADLNNQSCTYQTKICINNSDPRLPKCTATELNSFEVNQPKPLTPHTAADIANTTTLENQAGSGGFGATVMRGDTVVFAGSPNATANLCSGDLSLIVPMVIKAASGEPVRTVKRFRITGKNIALAKDPDTLQLDCRPSTCGDGFIQADHETCDQGGNNRVNGDGCNQACQTETGPTNTPGPSNSPTFTATLTPTGTPTVPPPTATATVPAPTATPTPPLATPTPTASQGSSRLLLIAPGGGSDGNCRGVCSGGINPGASCGVLADCRVCSGGTRAGLVCNANGNCPGGTCPAGGTCGGARTCSAGPRSGLSCGNAADCNACAPNNICTGAGTPLACCTGLDAGNCPLVGGCALIQNTVFPIRVPLNGVCVPRAYPDRGCSGNLECAPLGKTCQYSSVTLDLGSPDVNGEMPVTIQQNSVILQPARVVPVGMACVGASASGIGTIDCDGGRLNLNFAAFKDHNTTPGNPGNSGTALGMADDPSCANSAVQPDGSTSFACLEGTKQCVAGINDGDLCMVDGECPGSTCAPCTTQPAANHGVCNSPTVVNQSGTFGAGDGVIALPLSITLLSLGPNSFPPAPTPSPTAPPDWGVDFLPCTADDTIQPAGGVIISLSTGLNQVTLYDATNAAGVKLGPSSEISCASSATCPNGETCVNTSDSAACSGSPCVCRTICGPSPCLAELTGTPISCANLNAGLVTGLSFGGGFPAFDTAASDIATLFRFQAQ